MVETSGARARRKTTGLFALAAGVAPATRSPKSWARSISACEAHRRSRLGPMGLAGRGARSPMATRLRNRRRSPDCGDASSLRPAVPRLARLAAPRLHPLRWRAFTLRHRIGPAHARSTKRQAARWPSSIGCSAARQASFSSSSRHCQTALARVPRRDVAGRAVLRIAPGPLGTSRCRRPSCTSRKGSPVARARGSPVASTPRRSQLRAGKTRRAPCSVARAPASRRPPWAAPRSRLRPPVASEARAPSALAAEAADRDRDTHAVATVARRALIGGRRPGFRAPHQASLRRACSSSKLRR